MSPAMKSSSRSSRLLLALLGAGLLTPGAARAQGAPDPADVERELRVWLGKRFPHAFVKVREVRRDGIDAVVTALPSRGGTYDGLKVGEMIAEMDAEVLERISRGLDFAPGSQFVVLSGERFNVDGAGEELTAVVGQVARAVLAEATNLGLSVRYLSATGYAGPMVGLEVEAQGMELGPAGQDVARQQLEAAIQDRVMGGRFPFLSYLPEESFVEVLDAERPGEAAPAPPASPAAPPAPPPQDPVPAPEATPMASAPDPADTLPGYRPAPEAPVTDSNAMFARARQRLRELRPIPPAPEPPQPEAPLVPSEPEVPTPQLPHPADSRDTGWGRLVREARLRAPWDPPMPPSEAADRPAPEPPRAYPAAPFGVGPGVASCELFLYFHTDRAELVPEEVERLNAFLSEVPPSSIRGVEIVGYADSRHTERHNLDLGWRRGRAVETFLVDAGVPAPRVRVVSRGEGDPVADNTTDRGRSLNRRVLLEVSFEDPDRPMHRTVPEAQRTRAGLWNPPRHGPSTYPKNREGTE